MAGEKRRILLDHLFFPEGPRWHDGRLWVSDQHAHRVLAIDLEGRSEVVAELDDMPSGLAFTPKGELLVVSMRRRQILSVGGSDIRVHADLSGFLGHGWLNDMVVDSKGRAYVGHRGAGYGHPTDKKEWVLLAQPNGQYRVAADCVEGPNGSIITPDGKTLILAETRAGRLTMFRIAEDGTLSDRRTFVQFEPGAHPDGICLDAEGAIWTGCDGACIRVRDGGEITDTIEMEGGRTAVACMLGGADRRTLFILATHFTLEQLRSVVDAESDARSPCRGRIEVVQVKVPGAGLP